MNARFTLRTRKTRMAAAAFGISLSLGGAAKAALLAPTGLTPAVPAEFVGFAGLTWVNQQPAPAPSGGLPVLQMYGIGVYRSVNSGSWSRIALLAPGSTQYTVSPIQRETNYRFRIRLEPSTGFFTINHQRLLLGQPLLDAADFTSSYSGIVPVAYGRVPTPSILTTSASLPTSIRITWQETEPGAVSSKVKVMRKDLGTGFYFDEQQFTVDAPATSFDTPPVLLPNTRYGIQVKSVDLLGNESNWTTIRDRATLATTPTSLRVMLGSNNIVHLSWNDYLANSGIQVHFTTSVGFTQIDGNPAVAGVNNFPAAIPGVALTNTITDSNVHFTVCAVNLDGIAGPFASPVTIASGPSPPANRLILRNNSQLPLRSVRIDGQEMVVSGFNIPAGGRGTIVLAAGAHTLHASGFNSMCNRNTLEFPSAGSDQSFTLAGAAVTNTIPSITLRMALSQNGGFFEALDGYGDWYLFAADGTWAYGEVGTVQVNGTFSGSYSPGISTVNMSYAGGTFSAVFNECDGTLTIPVFVFNPITQAWEEEEIVYAR